MARRIQTNVSRTQPISVRVNGETVEAFAGETVATVLLASDVTTFNVSGRGQPRAPYCNMGVCFECLVNIERDGHSRRVRACVTYVEPDMSITTAVSADSEEVRAHAD